MKKKKTRKIPTYDLAGGASIIVGIPPHETLAKALAAVASGERIILREGTYIEQSKTVVRNNIVHSNGACGITIGKGASRSTVTNCTVKD